MSLEIKRWKAEIWLENQYQPVIIYGESLASLRRAAKIWLLERQPLAFSNTPPHYRVPEQRRKYLFSDGHRLIPTFSLHSSTEQKSLDEGWYRIEGNALFPQPIPLENFTSAVTDFVEADLIIEPGPNYKQTLQRTNPGWPVRVATHPALLAAAIGAAAAFCYLAVPIYGGSEKNFVFAHQSPLAVGLFFVLMITCFLGFGFVLYNAMVALEAVEKRQKRPQRRTTEIEPL